MSKKFIGIFHDDLDGIGSRMMFDLHHIEDNTEEWSSYCTSIDAIPKLIKHLEETEELSRETIITFGDISPSIEDAKYLSYRVEKVEIYDHHPTAFPVQQVFPHAVIIPENTLGVKQCGTSLLYQHYAEIGSKYFTTYGNQKLLSKFVENVRCYDNWEWKDTNNIEAKQLCMLYFMLGQERFMNRYLGRFMDEKNTDESMFLRSDLDFIEARLENEQRSIDKLIDIDQYYQFSINGFSVAMIMDTKGANVSELGSQFLENNPDIDIFLLYSPHKDGGRLNFRTQKDNIDLGVDICKPLGGGGHPKAAGAPLEKDFSIVMVDNLITYLKEHITKMYEGD